uniref:Uncharacterized protein n=1 Tax=Oryza sativa subsp. japonica TaxID=39947 RepID=Q6Z005_ORYSJ|nr:hypothetical protein [Oryza sativa Japonica Group]
MKAVWVPGQVQIEGMILVLELSKLFIDGSRCGQHGGKMTNMETLSPIRGDEDVGCGDEVAHQQRWRTPPTMQKKKPIGDGRRPMIMTTGGSRDGRLCRRSCPSTAVE